MKSQFFVMQIQQGLVQCAHIFPFAKSKEAEAWIKTKDGAKEGGFYFVQEVVCKESK